MHRFRKYILPLAGWLLSLPLTVQAGVITADPVDVGVSGQYFEATTDNNVVLHIPITAGPQGDTLQALSIDNYMWDDPPALEPADLAANNVKLWYLPVDTGTFNPGAAQLVGVFTFTASRGGYGWDLTGLSHWVGNGGALYVTVKISDSPTAGNACRFTVGSSNLLTAGGAFPGMDLPVSPPRLVITSVCPADHLTVSHTNTGQILLSTGQTFTPMQFRIANPDPDWPLTPLAPIFLSGLTLTVRDAAGSLIAPSSALDQIGVRDLDTGIFTLVSSLPAAAVPCYIPLSVSIQAADTRRLEIFGIACSNTTTVVAAFRLEWNAGTNLAAADAYLGTGVPVLALGDAFPMTSNLFSINYAAKQAQVFHTPVLPAGSVVLKGQTNVNPLNFTFINPGNSNTARIDVTRITLAVSDAAGNTLNPASVFSRMAIGGGILYGETTTLP
ncbi:MAG: hypothetical protein HGA76_08915, partial [Candidatus Firestonebacteria bacterium]|nr:hypothetical protein [Candidatus Firestonebacteria bacterium]